MIPAALYVDTTRSIGEVDPFIFGQYLEHVQPDEQCIDGGIINETGLRHDVIDSCRNLQVPIVRWPGGCYADFYHWQDGVGPYNQRPIRRNWHWGGLESNRFGTDEFLTWCEQVGCAPYINVNLGTGTLDEALRWIDYCNGTELSSDVLLRKSNGRTPPYQVPFWGIGNEQWGTWEAGHMNAQEYAQRLRNWAQFLRKADPQVKILGVGSHNAADPNWDLAVLRTAGNQIDLLTTHTYAHALVGDHTAEEYYSTIGNAVLFQERLQQLQATIAAAMTDLKRTNPIRIALDEWNVRHMEQGENGKVTLNRKSPRTLTDALFVASVFHAMMRLAPHVAMACYVFLVNGNGVLLAGPGGIVHTPLYDVFNLYRRTMQGCVVETQVEVANITQPIREGGGLHRGALRTLDYIDTVAVQNRCKNTLSIAVVNRHFSQPISMKLHAGGLEHTVPISAWELFHPNTFAANTFLAPNQIQLEERSFPEGAVEIVLKPHSLTLLQFSCGR